MRQLFLGGVRSGKSQLAEAEASASGATVIYIATARLLDNDMRARARAHRARRPANWRLVEAPLALASALRDNAAAGRCVLIDCLTLWLGNLLAEDSPEIDAEVDKLLALLPAVDGELIVVSGEVGLGVMPANTLARRYADCLGELNQAVAQHCQRVTLALAGLPHILKDAQS